VIKYLGSKRLLLDRIVAAIGSLGGVRTVLDPFSGTARVGHALKRAGYRVIASDHNAYAHTLACCYVQADAERVLAPATTLIDELNHLARSAAGPAHTPGYFTRTFCEEARYFHPKNGQRIERLREAIARKSLDPDIEAVLLVSLMEAADRVDSTTGVQMAYLKQWAARAHNDLQLRVPDLLPQPAAGPCEAHGLDALEAASRFEADAAYLDPPYNQHSYLGNYHVWETLVRWDEPEPYGTARKRADCRTRQSAFNSRRTCRATLEELIRTVRAPNLVVSCNDEGFVTRDGLEATLALRGDVHVVEIDYKRYVGAQIGIYNPAGEKVGKVGRLRNREFIFIASNRPAPPAPPVPTVPTVIGPVLGGLTGQPVGV
jgi:adenine-specific DNA-methyltransferase